MFNFVFAEWKFGFMEEMVYLCGRWLLCFARAHKIFSRKGCQVVRTTMYKGFAPFLEGVKGDRRVTGSSQLPSAFCRWKYAGLFQSSTCLWMNSLENWGANRHFIEIKRWLTVEFSREFAANSACYANSVAHYPRLEVLGNYELWTMNSLSPSCHPWHPPKRLQMPMYRAFWQPDTLFSKNSYICD